MRIVIEKEAHCIELEGNCHAPNVFEFAWQWIESVMYMSAYPKLDAHILLKSRDSFILDTKDADSFSIFRQLFRNQWVLIDDESNLEGPTFVATYVRKRLD